MKNILFLLLISASSFAQKITLSGYVQDSKTGEKLLGANIYNEITKRGTTTNNYGFFSLAIPEGNTKIKISFVGYATQTIEKNFQKSQSLNIELNINSLLQEVVVQGKSEKDQPIGKMSIPIETLKNLPSLMGEADVIRALSFTPGISTGQEGTTGLYVRGGSPDQNLILLDEAPIYNAAHFGGFFSVFNPNALKSMDVYKSGFPARFGGRLSSVLDITMKDGNNKEFEGEATLGIMGSNLTLQGPLKKNKASFIVSARYSNLGLLSGLVRGESAKDASGERTSYSFYDMNAKLNYQITDKTQVFLSVFSGYDIVKARIFDTNYDNNTDAGWGNTTGTFRLSHIISPKVFAKVALIYSKFENSQATDNYRIDNGTKTNFLNYQSISNVEDLTGKIRFDIFPTSNITMLAGIDFIKHNFQPTSLKTQLPISADSLKKFNVKTNATEIGIYLENDIHLSSKLLLNIGARYANYQVENQTYNSFEPRLGLNYDLGKDWTLKFGQSTMRQFVHLLSNNGVGLPNDIWLPATTKVPPQFSNQTAFGIYKKIPKLGLELSVEAYNKTMLNLIDYPEGSNFLATTDKTWDEQVEKNGRGRAYGLEFYLAKNTGKLTGWIAYTLSKTGRTFENINNGNWYPSRYDRPHNLSIVGMYKLSSKWSVNATWIYQTGHAVTLPDAAMSDIGYYPTLIYSGRNNQRMPDSHRLDIGFSRKTINKRGWEKTLNLGLYNAYNQANPYALDVVIKVIPPDLSNRRLAVKQYSLFPILPSISYSVKF
jgi:hypothetical protein